ncbi:Sulphatase-modifying factor protein [[Leptolyngbya] sp. PCC 7376]|uniref:formylglycine-generating enzyme family protein n=1 Tax=[Leptolyngbya] sp. PCC 7376 TaxID=111781 RepID=UPI00029F4601|nr:formylglycine-generating enzyme family protein [[Leptolyngbya] sp. PCC 7376]AFY40391.1 Sulphatase-modifying factor protein [[Leptolyngbya] sp. PCC 7376]
MLEIIHYKEILVEEPEEIAIDMTKIDGGGFWMGTSEAEIDRLRKEYGNDWYQNESPQHWVEVPEFFLGKYPITQAQWKVVAGWRPIERELDAKPSKFEGDNLPVEQVSWLDAKEFCARLSKESKIQYRLPTEAEWEYSCRGVVGKHMAAEMTPENWNKHYYKSFHFGQTINGEIANFNANEVYGNNTIEKFRGRTTPVGSFDSNNFQLYDMHGNVWEWCEDDYHRNYEEAPQDASAWQHSENQEAKVLRGGSWFNHPRYCRSAFRYVIDLDFQVDSVGFRIACAPPQVSVNTYSLNIPRLF